MTPTWRPGISPSLFKARQPVPTGPRCSERWSPTSLSCTLFPPHLPVHLTQHPGCHRGARLWGRGWGELSPRDSSPGCCRPGATARLPGLRDPCRGLLGSLAPALFKSLSAASIFPLVHVSSGTAFHFTLLAASLLPLPTCPTLFPVSSLHSSPPPRFSPPLCCQPWLLPPSVFPCIAWPLPAVPHTLLRSRTPPSRGTRGLLLRPRPGSDGEPPPQALSAWRCPRQGPGSLEIDGAGGQPRAAVHLCQQPPSRALHPSSSPVLTSHSVCEGPREARDLHGEASAGAAPTPMPPTSSGDQPPTPHAVSIS